MSPYNYPGNVPKVSKNWSASEQRKCTAAANAALAKGRSEKDAVFACIGAAGKGKNKMKAVTKKEGDGNHPSSHYLVVEDPSKPSTWHLRVRDANGKVNHTLMGAAWAALHGGYRGNKYQGPGKASALGKLRRLYSSEGMSMPSEKTTAFFKDKSGALWFMGIYSNNFIDRQKEIITEKAHEEYAAWIKQTGIRPPVILMHQPQYPDVIHFGMLLALATGKMTPEKYSQHLGELYEKTAIAEAVTVRVLNGFAFVVGKVFDNKKDVVEMLMRHQDKWGMSHGFIPIKTDDNIIEQYRTFEFSLAPEEFLANDLTAIGFKQEIKTLVEKLTDEEREAIEGLFEETDTDEVTKKTREMLRGMLASKMTPAEDPSEDEEEEATDEAETTGEEEDEETEDKPEGYKSLVIRLVNDLQLGELAVVLQQVGEKITAQDATIQKLNARLDELTRTEDEKVAEQFKKDKFAWMPNFKKLDEEPAQQETQQIDKLKGDIPETIVEGALDPKNVLVQGFWSRVPIPR